jgi:hypothetical protein
MPPLHRLRALTLTLALLVPLAGVEPTTPPPPPVAPVTPPVTPARPAKAVTPAPPAPIARPPAEVPSDAAQAEALKALRNVFKDEYAPRRKADERQAFARKLLEQGRLVLDQVERFVFLSEASAQAAKAGDHTTVLEAQDELAAQFLVPARDLRLAALDELAPNLPSVEAASATVEAMLQLADGGIEADDYAFAARACKEADALARRLKDAPLVARIKGIADRARELADEFKKVGEVEDLVGYISPDAHLRFGQFLCFAKGDWQHGLPHLADSSDAAIKTAAANELAAAQGEGESPLKVADGWWDLAQRQRSAVKEEILAHIQGWYRRASSDLSGAGRARVDKRLEDIERLLTASGRHSGVHYPHGAVLLLTCERDTLVMQGGKLTQIIDGSTRGQRIPVTGALPQSGAHGTALAFNGEAWLDAGSPKELQITGSQTIAFWINPTVLDARRNPFAKSYVAEGTMTLEPSGSINYFYGIVGKPYTSFALAEPLVPKLWAHVALVRDFTAMKMLWYKNGKQDNERAAPFPSAAISSDPVLIGKGYTNPFIGQLDDIGVWPRALSAQEIQALYAATATGR